jgi:hypothetical protein
MTAAGRGASVDRTEAAFDRALASTARSLVAEPLPTGVLDEGLPAPAGSRLRSDLPVAMAALLAVASLAVAIRAPAHPAAGPTPAFRTGTQISYDLRSAGYVCRSGPDAPAGGPRMDAIVCATTGSTFAGDVVISEDPAGAVGEVHVAADWRGSASAIGDSERADRLRALVGVAFADAPDRATAGAWLEAVLPLAPGAVLRTSVDGTPVVLERTAGGGYRITIGDLGGGPAASTP